MPYSPPDINAADFRLDTGYVSPDLTAADFDLRDVFYDVAGAIIITYAITVEIKTAIFLDYGISSAYCLQYADFDYAITTSAPTGAFDLDWSAYVQADTVITLPETSDVISSCLLPWGYAWEITAPVDLDLSLLAAVVATVDLPYVLLDTSAVAAIDLLYNLETMTPVLAAVELINMVAMPGQSLSLALSITADGVPVTSAVALSLAWDRRQYYLSATIELADAGEYHALPVGTVLEITITGSAAQTITMVITDRGRSRSLESWIYNLTLASPAALLDTPFAAPFDGKYAGMASDIAASLAAPLPITWNTVNAAIPVDIFSISQQTSLEGLRPLVGAPGAIIVSELDGSLTVEPEYPAPLPTWAGIVPAYTVSDVADIFDDSEDEDFRRPCNSYLVTNGTGTDAATATMRLEDESNDDGSHTIRLYTEPWQRLATLTHAGGNWVQLEKVGDEIRTIEEEIITIAGGEGSTAYPIYDLDDHDYREDNLGAVSWLPSGAITTAQAGDSLLAVSYRTLCRTWLMRDPQEEEVLLIAETPDENASGISVLVQRSPGDSQGPDVQDILIVSDEVARERGRNLIDKNCSARKLVTANTPFRSLLRPGGIIEVIDAERPRWRGLLIAQTVNIAINEAELTATATLTIEREL